MKINIEKPESKERCRSFQGFGMVSGNNSSRLLLDYKAMHPKRYNELLQLIFGKDGLNITHLKLEMGADINSSSGTEPAVKRFRDEAADTARGAGYQLACDAKRVNPALTLDMLYWSEPKWVSDSHDVYNARYSWYAQTLRAAYKAYKLKFDCVSVNRNERAVEPEWIKYFAKRIKAEKDCPYDFSKIKIIAADEENSWHISDLMAEDEELRSCVDIIGSHYTSHSTPNTKKMSSEYGKEIWFTEGCPPMSYSKGTFRFDHSGLSGINGVLDIADRIIAMYPCGSMSLYEFQPVVSAYYDGVCYCHKQLIDAKEPWSGYYNTESGFYMALHFSRFIKKGWHFIDSGCGSDGEKGGDGHALVNTKHSYMTAYDPETEDLSIVMSNSTDKPVKYEFYVKNLITENTVLDLWETRGNECGEYNENYFKKVKSVSPALKNGSYVFEAVLLPFSLVTVTTVKTESPALNPNKSRVLTLPYRDDFSYKDFSEDFLAKRGYAPLYTTDQGGAFEVTRVKNKNVLMQKITPEAKAEEWGYTPLPATNFGDDRWFNYELSAYLSLTEKTKDCYGGIGLRFCQACREHSGYSFIICGNGAWKFFRNGKMKKKGIFDAKEAVKLTISADKGKILCFIGEKQVCRYNDVSPLPAGRGAFYSSYHNNFFEKLEITPVSCERTYITRVDDTDKEFEYFGKWEHRLMSGYGDYKRTVSIGQKDAGVRFSFNGSSFGIFGESRYEAVIALKLDGKRVWKSKKVKKSDKRELFCFISGLEKAEHIAEITVLEGELTVDGGEIG